ncbi:hypothetical protein L1887_01148 [Cichorium endivia]|nr:hypothetical protein L1887_01148 [Cichorium endivia]
MPPTSGTNVVAGPFSGMAKVVISQSEQQFYPPSRTRFTQKTEVVYQENPTPELIKLNNFSYAIVVTGEYPYSETVGDSLNLTIPEPGPTTIMNICGALKCVVVLILGRPVVIKSYVSQMDALVAAWLPGTEGQGVTDNAY